MKKAEQQLDFPASWGENKDQQGCLFSGKKNQKNNQRLLQNTDEFRNKVDKKVWRTGSQSRQTRQSKFSFQVKLQSFINLINKHMPVKTTAAK